MADSQVRAAVLRAMRGFTRSGDEVERMAVELGYESLGAATDDLVDAGLLALVPGDGGWKGDPERMVWQTWVITSAGVELINNS